jgi:fido (protein-threonine AMPylation protein)
MPADQEKLKKDLFETTKRLALSERPASFWTRGFLQDVHQEIFGGVAPHVGGILRREEVGSEFLEPPAWQHVPSLTESLAGFALHIVHEAQTICENEESLSVTFLKIAEFHARCVNTQPFIDGNKRWARSLLVAILVDCGYFPGAVIDDTEKIKYMSAIRSSHKYADHEALADLLIQSYLDAKGMHDSGQGCWQ